MERVENLISVDLLRNPPLAIKNTAVFTSLISFFKKIDDSNDIAQEKQERKLQVLSLLVSSGDPRLGDFLKIAVKDADLSVRSESQIALDDLKLTQ